MSETTESVRPIAPTVVAVVVTHDPGPWFDETLESLASQDYSELSVVVVDAGSAVDPTPRVAAVLPAAYVRRLGSNPGYGVAANEVRALVEGAAFYLFCHDDVAPEPAAVRALVDEALRSNAGICGPKLVRWEDVTRLRQVGLDADHRGHVLPVAEDGELDQEQHDAVQDVFVIPGGFQLVRSDLFEALGGFEPDIDFWGEDLDLCWRAHCAGARVLVVPSARVRHREALSQRRQDLDRALRIERHRRLVVRTCPGPAHRWRGLPMNVAATAAELVGPVLGGHPAQSLTVAKALGWSLRQGPVVRRRRRAMRSIRHVSDGEVANLQLGVLGRLTRQLRSEEHEKVRRSALWRGLDKIRNGEGRAARIVWSVALVLFLLGSRHAIGDSLPAVGEFGASSRSAWSMLRDYAEGYRSSGVDTTGTPSSAHALLGVLAMLCFGALGLARTLAVLGPVIVGWIGIWRLGRRFESRPARLVTLGAFAANPLPYNALATGRWGVVVVWGMMPWVVSSTVDILDAAAGSTSGADHGWRQALGAAVPLAVAAAFEPVAVAVFVMAVACLAVAALATGTAPRVVGHAVGAAAVTVVSTAVLHLPWTLDLLRRSGAWSAIAGLAPASPGGGGAGDAVSFHTGPLGAGVVGLGVLAPMAVALLWGRTDRFVAMVRWSAMLGGSVAAWLLLEHGAFDRSFGPPGLWLIPGAVAVAMGFGVAFEAFQRDVRGRRLGLRQPVAAVAMVVGALALTPVLTMVPDGRWELPRRDLNRSLAALDQSGQSRTLWLGDPAVMPVGGWWLTDGLAYAITDAPRATMQNRWAGSPTDQDSEVRQLLKLAGAADTARLGRLLGPVGIRYVIVVQRRAPALTGVEAHPVPDGLLDALGGQLDLRRVDVDDSLVVYENAAWLPVVSTLGPGAQRASALFGIGSLVLADLSGSAPALAPAGRGWSGPVDAGSTLYVAHPFSDRWRLEVDGARVESDPAFGWSATYPIAGSGTATLELQPSWSRRLAVLGQALAWLVLLAVLAAGRRRSAVPRRIPVPVWFEPLMDPALSTDQSGGPERAPTPDELAHDEFAHDELAHDEFAFEGGDPWTTAEAPHDVEPDESGSTDQPGPVD